MGKVNSVLLANNLLPGNTDPVRAAKKLRDNKSISIKKDSAQKNADDENGIVIYPPYENEALAELFDMNSYHSRCCKVKAGVTVLLGYSIYDPVNPENMQDENYKKADDIIKNSIRDLYNVQLDHEIFGNGYIEIVRNNKGEVSELYHIAARDSYLVRRNKKIMLKQVIGTTEIYYKPFEGEKYDAADDRHEFVQVKNYNPGSRYYGVPDYLGAVPAMYLDIAANEFNTRRFSNNAIPDSVIKMYGFDKDADTESNIKNFFQGNFKGPENAGKALLLWADTKDGNEIEIEKMGAEVKEASFRGLRQDNRDEILAAHGVPARLAGVESAAKLSGGNETREQLKLFNEIIIIPRQKSLARILNEIIDKGLSASSDTNINWKMKFDTFEFANASEDADYYKTMVGSGILDADEARAEMGYPPRKSH